VESVVDACIACTLALDAALSRTFGCVRASFSAREVVLFREFTKELGELIQAHVPDANSGVRMAWFLLFDGVECAFPVISALPHSYVTCTTLRPAPLFPSPVSRLRLIAPGWGAVCPYMRRLNARLHVELHG